MTSSAEQPRSTSPADVPLVAGLLNDPRVKVVPRAIDNRWVYNGVCAGPISGFNPTRAEVYCARESAFGRWLQAQDTPARSLNVEDRLIREALFAAHDYLHAWSALEIASIAPDVGFGSAPITADSFEDFVFCQLATEAAATVGLDYWYLGRIDLESELKIGTCIRTLTTSYHEDHRAEYRRFCPELEVQAPSFFDVMARFYCSGRLPGFREGALARSPRVLRWLRHELSYGCLQRRYTRQWLAYLAGPSFDGPTTQAALEAPVAIDADWKRAVLDGLAHRLWAKVHGCDPAAPNPVVSLGRVGWNAPESGPLDFRFTNVNSFGAELWDAVEERGVVPDSFPSFFAQYVCAHDFDAVPPPLVAALSHVSSARSSVLLRHALSSFPRVESSATEPDALFVLS